ncbi:MAG TPA: anti-sigma factor [Terriglobia bacterium]|nr:anti-sigma factor [Terriglobia bacterium]
MNCLTDGILRARLDGELSGSEQTEAESHLAACAECRRRSEAMAHQAERVHGALLSLDPAGEEEPLEARVALARFRAERVTAEPGRAGQAERPTPLRSRLFAPRLRPAWGALAALVAVAALVSFAPARSWAQKILAMMRVQKIAVVALDPSTFAGSATGGANEDGKMIGKLISDNLVVTMNPGKPQPAASADEASAAAGFKVRSLTALALPPAYSVQGEGAFHMTLNRERLQSIVTEAGRTDIQLPPAIDGATIAVHVPKAVFVRYGNCHAPGSGSSPGTQGSAPPDPSAGGAASTGCTLLAEVPSPTVSVPQDFSIQQVAEAGLELAGMSADAAKAFCQTVDWTSTLVIPIPRDATSYQTVDVDGVQGTLINTGRKGRSHPAGYTLLWVSNGVVYSLMAQGDSANAVPLANSLQ